MQRHLYFDASVLQYHSYRGVHVYALNLLREMAFLSPDVQLHLHFGMKGWNSQIDELLRIPNITSHRHPGIIGRHLVPPVKIAWTRSTAYCLLNGNTGRIRVKVPCATAAVFHDMRLILYPQLYGKRECEAFAANARKWIRKLQLVITGSETVKKEIVDYFGIQESRIAVVSEGCDHRLEGSSAARPKGLQEHASYFLTVNPSDIRKNLSLVLDAFALYVSEFEGDQETLLVIAGVIAAETEYRVWREEHPEAAKRTISLGYITDAELTYLYRNAVASIYVSLYEGFGIPIIEAFREGCPAILSDIAVFREVAGDAGVYVDPHNAHALMTMMRNARLDPDLRNNFCAQAMLRASRFSWKASARVALDALLAL